MTQNFKNIRSLLYALALSAPICAGVQAQNAAPLVPTTPAAATPATPLAVAPVAGAAVAAPAPKLRKLSLVTEQGSFKSVFDSLVEAIEAAQGNSYNQTLKKGSEIVVMNERSTEGELVDKVTYSIYGIANTDLAPKIRAYLDYRPATPIVIPSEQRRDQAKRDRALTDEILKFLPVAGFPRAADSDAVPVLISFPGYQALRLEADNTQCPLIGSKMGDGFLYADIQKALPLPKRELLEKYGYNHYSTVQEVGDVAIGLPGTKVIVFNGTNFSMYRLGDFNLDYKAGKEQFDAFKTAPIRKGWIILAIVSGKEYIKIYDSDAKPNAK